MVDLQFMKLPLSGDFSVFKLLFGMACAMAAISTVFASTPLAGPALATSLEASRGGVDFRRRLAGALPRAPGGAVLHVRPLQVPHDEAQVQERLAHQRPRLPPKIKFPYTIYRVASRRLVWASSVRASVFGQPNRWEWASCARDSYLKSKRLQLTLGARAPQRGLPRLD